MSTRGCVGFVKDGKEKIGYNGHDSYPSGLGNTIINFLKDKSYNELNNICDEIVLTDDGNIEAFNSNTNSFNDTFEDYSSFLANSLFCEYAYIINLDEKVLEFYCGNNKNPNGNGRYAHLSSKYETRYYGVVLKKRIPLSKFFKGKIMIFNELFVEQRITTE